MKRLILTLLLLSIFLTSCSTSNITEVKEKLKQCYEKKCELILEEEGMDRIELPYPFSFCYYEARKGCIGEVSQFLDLSFCNNFKYQQLCVEDLAVIQKDKDLCKPTKNDAFFKEYAANYPDRNEDELFKEFSNEIEENMDYLPCSQYYETAIRTKESGNSHCENEPSGDYNCYAQLISTFDDIAECEEYRDILKSEIFGVDIYIEEFRANNCYLWFAATHDDISACKTLKDSRERDYCIQGYARAKYDPQYCEDIEDADTKGYCIGNAKDKMPYCTDYYGVQKCYGTL